MTQDIRIRTFSAKYRVTLDTATLSAHRATITVVGEGASAGVYEDGVQITVARGQWVRDMARATDGWVLLSDTGDSDLVRLAVAAMDRLTAAQTAPAIGNKAASTLHRDLARLGYSYSSSHLQIATDALERPIASLAALTAADAQTTYGYACAQTGQGSKVWAV